MIMVILYFQESPDLLPAEFRNSQFQQFHFTFQKKKEKKITNGDGEWYKFASTLRFLVYCS